MRVFGAIINVFCIKYRKYPAQILYYFIWKMFIIKPVTV